MPSRAFTRIGDILQNFQTLMVQRPYDGSMRVPRNAIRVYGYGSVDLLLQRPKESNS